MTDSKLKGMRDLSPEEVQVMNDIADRGNQLGMLIDQLNISSADANCFIDVDERWLSIGKTHLQTGIMCLKRAIGKPDNF